MIAISLRAYSVLQRLYYESNNSDQQRARMRQLEAAGRGASLRDLGRVYLDHMEYTPRDRAREEYANNDL